MLRLSGSEGIRPALRVALARLRVDHRASRHRTWDWSTGVEADRLSGTPAASASRRRRRRLHGQKPGFDGSYDRANGSLSTRKTLTPDVSRRQSVDYAYAVAVDQHREYLRRQRPSNFPTANPLQGSSARPNDVFVTKVQRHRQRQGLLDLLGSGGVDEEEDRVDSPVQ